MLNGIGLRALACGVFCLFFLPSCTGKGETEVIRGLIEKGARLAEGHDVGGLMEMTTEDFSALPGNRERAEVRGILRMAFRHYRQFRILYPKPGVDLSEGGNAASAIIYFLMVRQDRTYPDLNELYENPQAWLEEVGENADLYRLTLQWVKRKNAWLAVQARLDPFRGYGFGH